MRKRSLKAAQNGLCILNQIISPVLDACPPPGDRDIFEQASIVCQELRARVFRSRSAVLAVVLHSAPSSSFYILSLSFQSFWSSDPG